MSKSMINFTKGVVTGVVVGTTVGMVMNSLSKPAHPLAHLAHLKKKKGAGRMVKNIGSMVGHFSDMMR